MDFGNAHIHPNILKHACTLTTLSKPQPSCPDALCSLGDQNAINDLMQMRLSAGGGGGMMAEKLEVNLLVFITMFLLFRL